MVHAVQGASSPPCDSCIRPQETCVIIPRLKLVFDSGRCPQRAIFQQTLLLTHGHLDHIGGIPYHITSRNMNGLPPSRIVAPPGCESGLRQIMTIYEGLQGDRFPIQYSLHALSVGQQMTLPGGLIVRPFPTAHSVASQGYIVYRWLRDFRSGVTVVTCSLTPPSSRPQVSARSSKLSCSGALRRRSRPLGLRGQT